MKYFVVAVRDRAMAAFMKPFHVQSLGVAIRSFQDEVNRVAEDNPMHKHPGDFDLFHLGSFDELSGMFVNNDSPEQIAIGAQVSTRREA